MKNIIALSVMIFIISCSLENVSVLEKESNGLSEKLTKLDCDAASKEIRGFLVDKRKLFANGSKYLSLSKLEKSEFLKEAKNNEKVLESCQEKYGKDKSHGNFIKALANLSTISGFVELHEKNKVMRAPPNYVVKSFDDAINSLR